MSSPRTQDHDEETSSHRESALTEKEIRARDDRGLRMAFEEPRIKSMVGVLCLSVVGKDLHTEQAFLNTCCVVSNGTSGWRKRNKWAPAFRGLWSGNVNSHIHDAWWLSWTHCCKNGISAVTKVSELFPKHMWNVFDSSSSGIRQWLSTLRLSLTGWSTHSSLPGTSPFYHWKAYILGTPAL